MNELGNSIELWFFPVFTNCKAGPTVYQKKTNTTVSQMYRMQKQQKMVQHANACCCSLMFIYLYSNENSGVNKMTKLVIMAI